MASITKIIEEVNNSDIFSDNNSITRILSVLNNPVSTAKDVSDTIELNPPLASKVIQLANSPYFGGNGKIVNIKKAITWIGFSQIKELALNLSLNKLFSGESKCKKFNRKLLWKHSLATGIMSKQIARRIFRERGDLQYTIGILHDFGILIQDYFHHEDIIKLLDNSLIKTTLFEDLEQKLFGLNHIQISTELFKSWSLPMEIIRPIVHHLCPIEAEDTDFQNSAILFISNFIMAKNGHNFKNDLLIDDAMYEILLEKLNIEPEAIEIIFEQTMLDLEAIEAQGWI